MTRRTVRKIENTDVIGYHNKNNTDGATIIKLTNNNIPST